MSMNSVKDTWKHNHHSLEYSFCHIKWHDSKCESNWSLQSTQLGSGLHCLSSTCCAPSLSKNAVVLHNGHILLVWAPNQPLPLTSQAGLFFSRQHEKVLSVKTEFKHKLWNGIDSQLSTFLLKLLDNTVLVSVCDLSKSINASLLFSK